MVGLAGLRDRGIARLRIGGFTAAGEQACTGKACLARVFLSTCLISEMYLGFQIDALPNGVGSTSTKLVCACRGKTTDK